MPPKRGHEPLEGHWMEDILRLAKLFPSVPASAISQERVFLELKRRSAGLRFNTKIETLDRDAVAYSWESK